MRIFLYALIFYIAFVALLFVSQRRLLYLPSTTAASQQVLESTGLRFWPDKASDHYGFIAEPESPQANGTIIVFHGNAGAAYDRSYYSQALTPLGYRVILAEYPGYGGRTGKPSEKTLVADAKATIKLAQQTFAEPIYLLGESLGAGVVAAVVSDTTLPVSGLLLITPWDSLSHLAQKIYWFIPARWLVLDKYDNIRNLQTWHKPVAMLLAGQDQVVPKTHGQHLYDALGNDKKLWLFANSGHNTWLAEASLEWWQEVMVYLSDTDR